MRRLPPGQRLVTNWPVLHYGGIPSIDRVSWRLRVFGLVEHELSLSWDELLALPQTRVTTDIPLRDDVEPLRQRLGGRAHARAAGEGRRLSPERAMRSSTASADTPRTCRSTSWAVTTFSSRTRTTALRSAPSTAGRSAA